MKDNTKSREQSPLDYLQALCEEWWICNLRRKIYPELPDRKYYSKVCNLKKGRIQEICDRWEIDSIFTNPDLMKKLNKEFTKKGGMPEFKDATENDVKYYYSAGSDVRCFYGFDTENRPVVRLGRVIAFDLASKVVSVQIADNVEVLKTTQVSRIF